MDHPIRRQVLVKGLYVVATPIGHLSDVSARAADVLRQADWVAAEDTRLSAALLTHLGAAVGRRLIAAHANNEDAAAARIVERIASGASVALVTDAGTPGLSDPGARIVAAVHAAGLPVVPVPGASALTAMLSACGIVAGGFCFDAFLPASGAARDRAIETLIDRERPTVLFEAPHRIAGLLDALAARIEASRVLAIGRELTKRFEEIWLGTVGEAPAWLAAEANRVRGEFVLVLAAAPAREDRADAAALDRTLRILLAELAPAQAAQLAAKLVGVTRRDAYQRALALGGQR
jgi:16S rRNA (cytidine1402-2'-O)-methyltransferase